VRVWPARFSSLVLKVFDYLRKSNKCSRGYGFPIKLINAQTVQRILLPALILPPPAALRRWGPLVSATGDRAQYRLRGSGSVSLRMSDKLKFVAAYDTLKLIGHQTDPLPACAGDINQDRGGRIHLM
jgi:hypothetical protein